MAGWAGEAVEEHRDAQAPGALEEGIGRAGQDAGVHPFVGEVQAYAVAALRLELALQALRGVGRQGVFQPAQHGEAPRVATHGVSR